MKTNDKQRNDGLRLEGNISCFTEEANKQTNKLTKNKQINKQTNKQKIQQTNKQPTKTNRQTAKYDSYAEHLLSII